MSFWLLTGSNFVNYLEHSVVVSGLCIQLSKLHSLPGQGNSPLRAKKILHSGRKLGTVRRMGDHITIFPITQNPGYPVIFCGYRRESAEHRLQDDKRAGIVV